MSDPIIDTVNDLLKFATQNDLQEVTWKDGGLKVAFVRGMSSAQAVPSVDSSIPSAESAAAVEEEKAIIKSPMVGTFRRSLSKDRPPMVLVGNHVKPGDRLGVVECMKIPNDVVSFCAGTIEEILVEEGHAVEYGQPLFVINPKDESSL